MTAAFGLTGSTTAGAPEIEAIRAFNRFYTRKTGLLKQGLLESPYSLTEVRVLYELAHRKDLTATDLTSALGIDPGYLSRLLRRFEKNEIVRRKRSPGDGRSSILRLTPSGRAIFSELNARQSNAIARMIEPIPRESQQDLVASMRTIMDLLGAGETRDVRELRVRTHRPGDMGWVMFTHGVVYAREYDWDERFEALVGEIVVNFIRSFDPRRERCWIAELGDERVGSIFLVKDTDTVAKLRLLLVTPAARGRGVGKRLVDECIAFAREANYGKLTLWTNSVLDAARHIYEANDFRLVKEEKHTSFGHNLTGQYW
ncbi:MAG: bifunctional helix-turn-helix transcriptional regulator/GNAT family N-acetyltransferase, partial [Gemmatimonadota bacterium]|nr:bifunctional helix-turn-helix transcriptional regulator/GNAT family N-acetyltransferase [Gemmatimonadota bacterium]